MTLSEVVVEVEVEVAKRDSKFVRVCKSLQLVSCVDSFFWPVMVLTSILHAAMMEKDREQLKIS